MSSLSSHEHEHGRKSRIMWRDQLSENEENDDNGETHHVPLNQVGDLCNKPSPTSAGGGGGDGNNGGSGNNNRGLPPPPSPSFPKRTYRQTMRSRAAAFNSFSFSLRPGGSSSDNSNHSTSMSQNQHSRAASAGDICDVEAGSAAGAASERPHSKSANEAADTNEVNTNSASSVGSGGLPPLPLAPTPAPVDATSPTTTTSRRSILRTAHRYRNSIDESTGSTSPNPMQMMSITKFNRRGSHDSALSLGSRAFSEASNSSDGGSGAGSGRTGLVTTSGHSRKTSRSTFRLPFLPLANGNKDDDSVENSEYNNAVAAGPLSAFTMTSTLGFNSANTNNNNNSNGIRTTMRQRITTFRRYAVNDYVLISNHNVLEPDDCRNLVNRYGFPEWGGGATTSEERRGPYIYLLAKVTSVHFGEDAQYYTVRREDNNADQRADAQYMEPITDVKGIDAAKLAAHKNDATESRGERGSAATAKPHIKFLQPCLRSLSNIGKSFKEGCKSLIYKGKSQTDGCLNGHRPYGISCRFTGVNFFVLCSIWYLYIDQLRLAFMPHTADFSCAVVSLMVWLFLVLELMMEVFIRPSGYRALIRSEKAYLPSTVRYINTFHLISELISLIFFIPEFICLFSSQACGSRLNFSLANACLMSLYGPDRLHAFYGTSFICIMRLRIFGLVRHWTKMWINNTFVKVRGKNGEWHVRRGKGFFIPQGHLRGITGQDDVIAIEESITNQTSLTKSKLSRGNAGGAIVETKKKNDYTDDYHLTNASKIGTALFTTNAKRALVFVFVIGLTPLIGVMMKDDGGTNQHLQTAVELLQSNNLALNNTSDDTCGQLQTTITDWVKTNSFEADIGSEKQLHILSLQVQPVRCEFQTMPDGTTDAGTLAALVCRNQTTVSWCKSRVGIEDCAELCWGWQQTSEDQRLLYLEKYFGVRPSVTVPIENGQNSTYYSVESQEEVPAYFSVRALFNEGLSVSRTIILLFTMQLAMTVFVLLGLSVLRYDAGRLVLGPLRRMLKIVAFYAKNPLSPPPEGRRDISFSRSLQSQNEAYYDSDDETSDKQLGTFETEQLINAVTKITDLLRKCWGVAGAGIISSNLARQEGGLTAYFNPTVPGKAVYALFAFAVIDRFQSHLHALKGDIMILINDIAAVLHEEVYRWGYEDSGQCNKNLGQAFLMVYRIGAVSEVVEKREKAEAVIFKGKNTAKSQLRKKRRTGLNHIRTSSLGGSQRISVDADRYSRSRVDNLDLSSLPGMRTFTDRALLGLLKTFAGIHRDKTIMNWNNDLRLGFGVGAASINLHFGMDAGWAVEGAVGSSYKIDATYLSPHVNMASRMMSATKQYGVYFLLSQSVQKLLSEQAQDKLRHIDTVTVKGSSVQQKIFTYDAKVRKDFFLFGKPDNQADLDSDMYSPAIWNVDQDLVAMRNHICDEFMDMFNRGRDEYLAGNWPQAIELLKGADKIMFEREVEEGYSNKSYADANLISLTNLMVEDNEEAEERLAMGDGPCQRLIQCMQDMGGVAPDNWRGYRPLTSK